MQVRVREVVGTVNAMDGESLLSPQNMQRIVEAVIRALDARKLDADRRARDTRIGAYGHDYPEMNEGDR